MSDAGRAICLGHWLEIDSTNEKSFADQSPDEFGEESKRYRNEYSPCSNRLIQSLPELGLTG